MKFEKWSERTEKMMDDSKCMQKAYLLAQNSNGKSNAV